MFEHGDFLFTQIGTDQNAISAVTDGYRGALVNHMGIVLKNNRGVFVLEAYSPEVRVTQVDVFLRRSNDFSGSPRYILARLLSTFRSLIPSAVSYGLSQRAIPYDDLYLTDGTALYCSELVVDMFKAANEEKPFFVERPMSFRDKTTGQVLPAWTEYYAKFGMAVPDGAPGSNPGDISKDPRLQIVQVEGALSGYKAP